MLSRSVVSRQLKYPKILISRVYSSTDIHPHVIPQELRLSPHKAQQPQRLPFAKNFFLGNYDTEFAAFPVPQTTIRHGEFFEWLKPIEAYVKTIDIAAIDGSSKIPEDVLENLRELGVFKAAVPEAYRGIGLNVSEYGKLVETLSAVPVLGAYFLKKRTAVDYLVAYCSEEQQRRFLPGIASGELNPTICVSEDEAGSSDTPIFSYAKLSECERYFIINGKKTFVADARNSNVFIIVCEYTDSGKSFRPQDTTSAFIIEKNSGGMKIEAPVDTMGLRGLDHCVVHFSDCKIPCENLIGEIGMAGKSFVNVFGQGKQYLGSQAIGITRKFMELVVKHFKANKDFNAVRFKNELVQEVIGNMCAAIYGMESAVYLTTGMMDTFENQDCDMEKCMVEAFCAEECLHNILQGLQIIGGASNLRNELFQQFFRDAVSLLSSDGAALNSKVFVALLGLQYTGDVVHGRVKIERNPWNHPTYVLQKVFGYRHTKNLHIDDNLHPSLRNTAKLLEYAIARLKESMEKLTIHHGREIFERPATQKRIADFASYVYVMSACLARTSRSYCLGMRDADKELYLTQLFGYVLYERIKKLADQIQDSEWINGDRILHETSDRVFETNGYFVEHPLARNFS